MAKVGGLFFLILSGLVSSSSAFAATYYCSGVDTVRANGSLRCDNNNTPWVLVPDNQLTDESIQALVAILTEISSFDLGIFSLIAGSMIVSFIGGFSLKRVIKIMELI